MTDTTSHAAVEPLRRNPLQRGLLWLGLVVRYTITALSILVYLILAPWGYAAFALLVLVPWIGDQTRSRLLQAAMRAGFTLLHTWMGLIRVFDIRNQVDFERLPPGPFVIVANHPTLIDVTAILRAFQGSCTIVKPIIFERWWLRPLMKGSGQLVGAKNPLATTRLVGRAVDRIRSGMSIVIFPEATRTVEGREMPFHRMAFEIACRANVPVVCLHLRCDPSWLSKSRPLLKLPLKVPVLSISMLASLHPAQFDFDSKRLCENARSLYRTSDRVHGA